MHNCPFLKNSEATSRRRLTVKIIRINLFSLEVEAQRDIDVHAVGVTVPANRSTERTQYGAIVVIGQLQAPQDFALEYVAYFIVMLGHAAIEQNVVRTHDALL